MKIIALLALATAGFMAAPSAKACDNYVYRPTTYCAPTYVCTKEVCRRTECRQAVNSCGYTYTYQVVVISYADYYNDGSSKSYTRVYRA